MHNYSIEEIKQADKKMLLLLKKNKRKVIHGILKELSDFGIKKENLGKVQEAFFCYCVGIETLINLGIQNEDPDTLLGNIGDLNNSNNEFSAYCIEALLKIGFSNKQALYILDYYNPDKYPDYVLPVVKLVHSPKIRDWCKLSYPGHPKGCPNYGKYNKCPPNSPNVEDILDTNREMFLVYSEFNLQEHVDRMKEKHPNWTDRQLRNVLYWQRISKKEMITRSILFAKENGFDLIIPMGESVGINLYKTCRLSGLKLESIKSLKINHHVAVVGHSTKNCPIDGYYNNKLYSGCFIKLNR